MKKEDGKSFYQCLKDTYAVYGKKIDRPIASIYWRTLEAFELKEVMEGISRHLIDQNIGQYVPKPADIVRQIEESTESKALEAWSDVTRAIKSIGKYESVIFDDLLTNHVVEQMGGWVSMCKMTEREEPFKYREFEKRYARATKYQPSKFPNRLCGLFDQPEKEPIHIGYKQLTIGRS